MPIVVAVLLGGVAATGKGVMRVSDVYKRAVPVMAGLLSDSYRQGLPLPVRRDGNVRLAILAAPVTIGLREGTAIGAPSHVGEFDLTSAELLELRRVTGADFGQPTAANGPIGFYRSDLTFERTAELRGELFADLDTLWPAFARGEPLAGGTAREAARRFMQNFTQLREAPLEPYYDALGAEFFAWLKPYTK